MERSHFQDSPFQTPLYGEWIGREHPFVKTVIKNIDEIADKIDLSILIEAIEKEPGNRLFPFNKDNILDTAFKWRGLVEHLARERRPAHRNEIKRFLQSLAALSGVEINDAHNADHFIINIKNLDIGILDEAFCLVQDTPVLKKDEILRIENKALELAHGSHNDNKLILFFYFQESQVVKDLGKRPYLNLIPIDHNDIKKIILAENPANAFRKIILSRVSLHKISPYKTEGPAKAIFYGRSHHINQICNSNGKSFAVVGARKIGKTSLLHSIKDSSPPDVAYIFMSLEMEFAAETNPGNNSDANPASVKGYRTFLKTLGMAIEQQLHKKVKLGGVLFGKDLSKLPGVIQRLSRETGKRIVFIMDEIDGLILFDKKHSYKLMHLFRNMSQDNCCQFIFAGFKQLYHQKRDIENPMYNFCEEIKLKPLGNDSALDLITKPLESIGIKYKNQVDRDLILEYTGCHPNLLQFYCVQLIEKIEAHDAEAQRTILLEDIKEIFGDRYEEYIMDDVYMFKSDLSRINRLILLLLAEEQLKANGNGNGKKFFVSEIIDHLSRVGIEASLDEINRKLKNLVMRFILKEMGKDSYTFALSVFPEMLENNIDPAYKEKIIEEIKLYEGKSL
jgi:hypothetical protein